MARARSPNRDKAFEIYKEHNGNITNRDISKILNEDEKVIAVWKSRDKWNKNINVVQQSNKSCTTKRKRGGQPNNKNATGPPGNKNAEKHGLFSKYLPKETNDLIESIRALDSLEILWGNIQIQYAAIIRSQNIMYVEGKDDITKVLKKETYGDTSSSEEYELQFAWDKQATFLQAQSRAMKTLESMINKYEELVNKNWDIVTEEQKARLELVKAQTNKLTGDNQELEDTSEMDGEIYGD
ncbi:phage terminase small subunit [Clostridium baratii]|uniref:phage terminase small subunit n=1 Tax=Clostridium baratii TaxID=1561 RepID=UPI0030D3B39A